MVKGLEEYIKKYRIRKDKYGRLIFYKAVLNTRASIWAHLTPSAYLDNAEVRCRHFSGNRQLACGSGLHVGTLAFAKNFQGSSRLRIVIQVAVWPEDVVCVPRYALIPGWTYMTSKDSQQRLMSKYRAKIRVKKLRVIKEVTW